MPLYTFNGKLLRVNNKLAAASSCCCEKRVCWTPASSGFLPRTAEDIDVDESSDLSQCACVVAYRTNYCPLGVRGVNILSDAKIQNYVTAGGVYIVNVEWDNCFTLIGQPGNGCEPNAAWFDSHLSAIGAAISRSIPTAATTSPYITTGALIFDGCTIYGDATAGLSGGVPLAVASPGNYCANEPGGIPIAGAFVGQGAVVACGDSNIVIAGPIRDNILNNNPLDLF